MKKRFSAALTVQAEVTAAAEMNRFRLNSIPVQRVTGGVGGWGGGGRALTDDTFSFTFLFATKQQNEHLI